MTETRFAFGENWRRFLDRIGDDEIDRARSSLVELLGEDLAGERFLDVGCGSGLFSLAARELGATVHAFDFDERSVECAKELKRRFRPDDDAWTVERGSLLDSDYLSSLGAFDIVYAWGVVHHTGDLWTALDNVKIPVGHDGRLVVSAYNDQGWLSRYWATIKRTYNEHPSTRIPLIVLHAPYLVVARGLVRWLTGRGDLERGMTLWHDMIDWLGGFPFEVAAPKEVKQAVETDGFETVDVETCGRRHGCNEFVFRRV